MKRIVGYVIWIMFGVIGLCGGIYFFLNGFMGMQDVITVTGELKVNAQAKDELLGLTDMGPVIFREAQMYQNCQEEVRVSKGGSAGYYHYVKKDFSDEPQGTFEAYKSESAARRLFAKTKTYKNPVFPEVFLNENNTGKCIIYGVVEIGEDGIRLGESLLRYFDGSVFTMEDATVPAYNTPRKAGESFGLKLTEDGVYQSGDENKPQIGDIRVTYRVVSPEKLEGEFTAVGRLTEDNMLEGYEDYGALYQGAVTLEEADSNFKKEQYKIGLMFLLGGIAVMLGGFWLQSL